MHKMYGYLITSIHNFIIYANFVNIHDHKINIAKFMYLKVIVPINSIFKVGTTWLLYSLNISRGVADFMDFSLPAKILS